MTCRRIRDPFAVPEKIVGRFALFLDFFDRGTHLCLAASATGGARQRDPLAVSETARLCRAVGMTGLSSRERNSPPDCCCQGFADDVRSPLELVSSPVIDQKQKRQTNSLSLLFGRDDRT